MRTNTMFMIGGCAGSYAAPSENRPNYDVAAPWNIRREPFRRELYGSRTTSFLLRHNNTLIVIDQGLGVDPISEFILDMLDTEGVTEAVVHCVQTHFHEDHLEGLRCNALMFRKGLRLRFYSPDLSQFRKQSPAPPMTMEEVLASQFCEGYWPVTLQTLDRVGAGREYMQFTPGETFTIEGVTVRTIPLTHPGGCTGLRFEIPGNRCIVIATDYEPGETPDPGVVEFFDNSNLLLADMQYRDDEYAGLVPIGRLAIDRQGWGHGTPLHLLPMVLRCRTRPSRLRITHHDPRRSDMELRLFYEETVELLEEWKAAECFDYEFAHDGDIFWV